MLKKRLTNYKFGGLAIFLALLLGFLIGKFVSFQYFIIEKNINLIDILSIAVTISAAYWVTKILDKQKENFRTSKDLFLKRTDEISEIIRNLNTLVQSRNFQIVEITSMIKRINMSISSINGILPKNHINIDEHLFNKIKMVLQEINILLTFTNPNTSTLVSHPIQINSGNITITNIRLNEVEIKIDEFKNCLLQYELAINNT